MVLERLLRVRSLLEDAGRAELERQVRRAAQAEEARRRAAALTRQAHADSLAPLLLSAGNQGQEAPNHGPAETHRQGAERGLAQAEFLAGQARGRQLERAAAQQQQQMLGLRDAFLELRKERQQVEILLEAAARRRGVAEARREQRGLDDWYAATLARRRAGRRRGDL
jgi:hypothetical protein